MKSVFADAFYFVGLVNRADAHHSKVVLAARELREDVVTTEWILAEFADALAESAIRGQVARFIAQLEHDPKVRIIRTSTELFARGLTLYDERPDKKWSLTDCISFVVMKDAGLHEALTGGRHFEQAGFKALLK